MAVDDDDYLIDTMIISSLVSGRHDPERVKTDQQCQRIADQFGKISSSHIFLPTISIAEIEFGLALVDPATLSPKAEAHRKAIRAFFDEFAHCGIDDNIIEPYILIRSQLWKTHAHPKPNKSAGRGNFVEVLPEELFDNQAGKLLGIDEKDLLIFCTALQFNYKFVTCDSRIGMTRIIEAANALQKAGKLEDVRVENWNDETATGG
jgi:predicted nucleic acid-binding protein